jgi:hypothetical protein
MWQPVSILASALAVALSVRCVQAAPMGAENASETALRFFEDHRGETIEQFLSSHRPAALDAVSRSRVVGSFPADLPVVDPSRTMRKKMAAAERVLGYSARFGVITIRVIADNAAYAALYFRAILLVSTRTLDLLTTEEFAAVTAHELGHDFEWTEYWTAVEARDYPRLRQLELRSDGIAVLTLQAMGLNPERLATAAMKMTRCNEPHEGGARPRPDGGTGYRYVSLTERVAFIRAMARLNWADRRARGGR